MEEKDVGILCFANSLPGFRAVIKQRYSDFIVNEVDLDGNVVHLTSLDPPTNEGTDCETDGFSTLEYETRLDAFKALAGDENTALLKEFLQKISDKLVEDNDTSITLLPDSDKAHRTKVHVFFRENMPLFTTDTVEEKCIRVRYNNGESLPSRGGKRNRNWKDRHGKRQKHDFDRRGGNFWPPDRKKFCQFYLYKENKTTQQALMIVAQKIGVKAKNLGFAGTKDKRAVTTQRVTVFKHSATQLAAANKSLFGIKIGNFSYVDKGLVLGELLGNRFSIVLRDVVAENEDIIKEAAQALGKSGFVNYYGLQRFGTCGVATHAVGAKLLRGDWKGAVDLILQPREGEQQQAEEARKRFQTDGAVEALKIMPHHMIAERAILSGLKKDSVNFLQAIENIPRPMRMMYVHSYQSYLWNNAVSVRIQKYGIEGVVEGDLVYIQDDEDTRVPVEPEELVEIDTLEDDAAYVELGTSSRKKVKHVTKEDIESGKYSITDVVLPLVGSMTIYPANDVADVYNDLSKKDALDLKSSDHKVKEFSVEYLTGAYRNILVKPVDLEWKLLKYNDFTKPLLKTDLDKILDKTEEEYTSGGDFLALHLEFTLPTSAYATMALREVMKMSTSVNVHKLLSQGQDKE